MIDLATLPAPTVIETLDFETLYHARLARFKALYPAYTAALESDPVVKLLELAAYDELMLRARINDAARATMLAYATGADLDHLAALLDTQRQIITPADPSTRPPTAAVLESDERLRMRAQMSMEGTSVAGSHGAYMYHALSASGRVADATVDSPEPKVVRVVILSTDNDGVPDADLIHTVQAYLSADTRRPMTDDVRVVAPVVVQYGIIAELTAYPGPSPAPVFTAAHTALDTYLHQHHKLGHDITLSGIYACLHQPGVQRVTLLSPTADIVIGQGEVARCTAKTVTLSDKTDV